MEEVRAEEVSVAAAVIVLVVIAAVVFARS